MNDVYYELESRSDRIEKKAAKPKLRSLLSDKRAARTAVVLLWLLAAGGAFWLASYYIGGVSNQLDRIQRANQEQTAALNAKLTELEKALEANAEQAEALKEQFAAVESELNAVQEQMSLAGDSLSATAETKQALNDRITVLSKQLEELRKSIAKLEEAARVY